MVSAYDGAHLRENLPRLESVRVCRPWLEELRVLFEERRPAERRVKDGIDVNRTKAVLATDLVGGKALAIEIKVRRCTVML